MVCSARGTEASKNHPIGQSSSPTALPMAWESMASAVALGWAALSAPSWQKRRPPDRGKEDPGLLGRGQGRMSPPDDHRKALGIPDEGIAAGARAIELAMLLGVGLTTLQRWRS